MERVTRAAAAACLLATTGYVTVHTARIVAALHERAEYIRSEKDHPTQ